MRSSAPAITVQRFNDDEAKGGGVGERDPSTGLASFSRANAGVANALSLAASVWINDHITLFAWRCPHGWRPQALGLQQGHVDLTAIEDYTEDQAR